MTASAIALFAACSNGGKTSTAQQSSAPSASPSAPAVTQDTPPAENARTPVVGNGQPGSTPPADAIPPTPKPLFAHEWYVSNSGSDSAPGSSAQPFQTINKGIAAAGPGDRITVKAGTYREDVNIDTNGKDGTAAEPILLQGEGMPKIVPAGHSTMVLVGHSHWIIDGFEVDIEGQTADGVGFYRDASGSTLRNSSVHHGTGTQGINVWSHASDVTIEKNQIFDIFKAPMVDAHGVHVEWTTKNTVIRGNMISGNSGDDFQCEGPEPYGNFAPADGVTLEDNDLAGSFEQAFDIKTCTNVVIRNNHVHDFATGGGASAVIHMSASNVLVENNLFENVGKALALGGNRVGPMPANVVIRGNRMRGISSGPGTDGINREGVGIWIENADHPVVENNTILGAQVSALHIGGGVNGPTDGLTLRNNILAGKPLEIGPNAPGLVSQTNLFESGATIGGAAITDWLVSVGDSGSNVAAGPLANADTFAPAASAIDAATSSSARAACGDGLDIGAVETGCTP
ncbi:MAG: nitrous oxide reductase family maturation protein NosD [Myxococcaceae bacterium]